MERIRLFLAEDHTLVREGLKVLLGFEPRFEVVGEASDGLEAFARIPEARPDVLLLDLRMPRLDGLGLLQRFRDQGNLPPTLVLTTFREEGLLESCLQAGARGFVLKDVSLEQLRDAILDVAAGRTHLHPALREHSLKAKEHLGLDLGMDAPPSLTARERDILRLLAGGYSNREIAKYLDLAEGSVKNRVSTLLSKLGVRDRVQAVLKGLELDVL